MLRTSYFYSIVCFGFIYLLFAGIAHAQSAEFNPDTDTLVVGIAGTAPFIIETENPEESGGIAIEIWEKIANKKRWTYRYERFETVSDALKGLENGKVNLVARPISITSQRVERMGFTQPYYQSSLSIVSRVDDPSFWQKIKPFFSIKLLIAVGIFLLIDR